MIDQQGRGRWSEGDEVCPETRYNKWKFQEYSHSLWVLAFAAASRCLLGFPGLFTACKFFPLLFLSHSFSSFFYFLAISCFFVIVFVCSLLACCQKGNMCGEIAHFYSHHKVLNYEYGNECQCECESWMWVVNVSACCDCVFCTALVPLTSPLD